MGKYADVDHVGHALKSRRDDLGINQAQAAARLGVEAPTLSRWEHGLMEPTDGAHIAAVVRFLDEDDPRELERLFFALKVQAAQHRTSELSRADARILEELVQGRRQPPDDAQ